MSAQLAGADGGVCSRMSEWVSTSSLLHWEQMCRHRACCKALVRDTMDISSYSRGEQGEGMLTKRKGGSSIKMDCRRYRESPGRKQSMRKERAWALLGCHDLI